jgi:hypothetical protein
MLRLQVELRHRWLCAELLNLGFTDRAFHRAPVLGVQGEERRRVAAPLSQTSATHVASGLGSDVWTRKPTTGRAETSGMK